MTQGQTPFVGGQGRFKNDNDLLNLKAFKSFLSIYAQHMVKNVNVHSQIPHQISRSYIEICVFLTEVKF